MGWCAAHTSLNYLNTITVPLLPAYTSQQSISHMIFPHLGIKGLLKHYDNFNKLLTSTYTSPDDKCSIWRTMENVGSWYFGSPHFTSAQQVSLSCCGLFHQMDRSRPLKRPDCHIHIICCHKNLLLFWCSWHCTLRSGEELWEPSVPPSLISLWDPEESYNSISTGGWYGWKIQLLPSPVAELLHWDRRWLRTISANVDVCISHSYSLIN